MKIAALLTGVMLLSGCGLTYARLEVPPAETTAPFPTIGGATSVRVGPVIIPGVLESADKLSADVTCASVVHRLKTSTGDYAAVELIPDCGGTTDTPENGDHGYYPKPPTRAKAQQAETPLGTATIFTNQYSECTSSCYMGGDEVALLTVDGIVVQITAVTAPASGSVDRSRPDLVQLLQTLRHA